MGVGELPKAGVRYSHINNTKGTLKCTVSAKLYAFQMAVYSVKEYDYKSLEYALSRGSHRCNVNYLQRVSCVHLTPLTMATLIVYLYQ